MILALFFFGSKYEPAFNSSHPPYCSGSHNASANFAVAPAFALGQKNASSSFDAYSPEDQIYTGSQLEPDPTVTSTTTGKVLTKDTDYTLSYANNINPGIATITVTGKGYYTGTKTVTFKIKKELELIWSDTEFIYDGKSHVPRASVKGFIGKDSATLSVEGEQIHAAKYSATAKLSGNEYYFLPENASCDFTIKPKTLTLTWSNTELIYNRQYQAPTFSLDLIGIDTATLNVEGEQINAGTYTAKAIVTDFSSDYVLPDDITCKFIIAPKELDLIWSNKDGISFDGNSHIPSVTATGYIGTDSATLSVEGAAIDAGYHKAIAILSGNDNYTLPKDNKCTFYIYPKSIAADDMEMSFIKDQTIVAPLFWTAI